MKYGLLPTPKDDRDFKLGAVTTLPALSELPANFILSGFKIKNQRDSDFCTAYATCGASELQEGVRLSPEWVFAKSKEISGDPEAWGQIIRNSLKVHTNHGAPEATECTLTVTNTDLDKLRYIENYPRSLDKKAIKHIKKSYVSVIGQYDAFDDIRASIWKYRKERRAVITGVDFGWRSDQTTFEVIPTDGEGHCMYVVGWVTENGFCRLVYVNSNGYEVGDNGVHYVGRTVVNHFVPKYDAFMFVDMEPDQIRYMIENGITDKDNWVVQLYKVVISLTRQLLKKKL